MDALCGRTSYNWLGEDPADAVRIALERARETLTDRFGTADPSAWRLEPRTTEFRAISAADGPAIEMVNRGSWNQLVSLATGEGRGILPPGNSGHLSIRELPKALGGVPPARLTDQLGLYENFEYKPFPVERDAVEAIAERQESISIQRRSGITEQAFGLLWRWLLER